MPPKFQVRDILRTLDQANLENMLPVWDGGRTIVEEGHIALKDEMKFATRKYRAPYGLERVEMKQEENELDAAGSLYVALTEHKKLNPATPSPLSVGTPGNKRSGPVENRFRDILEKRRAESEAESMDETLSEAGEEMEVGDTPEPKPAEEDFTAQERNCCRTYRRRLGGHGHATSDIIRSEKPGIALDQRNFQHANDTLEYRREQEEHFRREQEHVSGDAG